MLGTSGQGVALPALDEGDGGTALGTQSPTDHSA